MVKKKGARQKVKDKSKKKSAIKGTDSTQVEESLNNADVHDHLQDRMKRKLAKRLLFYARLEEAQEALSVKKTISKKRRRQNKRSSGTSLDLSSLAEFLPKDEDFKTAPLKLKEGFKKYKSRGTLFAQETKQVEAVLSHPEFRANSFSAIQKHLEVVLAPYLSTESNCQNQKTEKDAKQPKGKKKLKMAAPASLQRMEL